MKTLLLVCVTCILAFNPAEAGSHCYQIGATTNCQGDGWQTQTYDLGSNRITNGTRTNPNTGETKSFTTHCYWIGSNRICN
jgi:hypothetical protein